MRFRLARLGVSATTALLLVFTVAMPVQADASVSETGTTGFHALRDSRSKPGYTCHYKGLYPPSGGDRYESKINRIDVRPPKMRAISGQQEVGWRFTVERRRHVDATPVWKVTYKSSIQRDTTSTSRNASFSMRGISVRLPADGYGGNDGTIYEYRVKVRMFWYTANGAVQGTSTHLADWYTEVLHNFPEGDGGRDGTVTTYGEQAPCRGWVGGIIN